MSRRQRKRAAAAGSKLRPRWWGRVLVVGLILGVLVMGGSYLWLRAWLHGESFRRMLAGQTALSPQIQERYDLQNLILFLGDDLRESALAVSGIEAFLLDAQRALENPDVSLADLRRIVDEPDVVSRIELLSDALGSLRRSIGLIHRALR